jgi:hypothetical protein
MLPIIGVIILYFIDNLRARLGVVAAFVAVFSLALAMVTDAKRADIFAATAGCVAPCHILSNFGLTDYTKLCGRSCNLRWKP